MPDASENNDGEDDSSGSETSADESDEAEEAASDLVDDNDDGAEACSDTPIPGATLPMSSSRDFMFEPLRDNEKFKQLIVLSGLRGNASLGFVTDTPDCPARRFTKEEARKVFAAHFAARFTEMFKSSVSVLEGRIFSVHLGTDVLAQRALDSKASVILGGHRVYAEKFPRRAPKVFVCDFLGQEVPEQALMDAIRKIKFSSKRRHCKVELRRYPGSRYVIHCGNPTPMLRLYLRMRWSDTQICIARFQPIGRVNGRECPLCGGKHAWPCGEATSVMKFGK